MKNKNKIRVDGVTYLVNPETKEATILKVRATKPKKGEVQGVFEVPDTVEGYKVTAIGTSAFSNCDWIKSIIFSENIREIQCSAFCSCENLLRIRFMSNGWDEIPTIREQAFFLCENLKCIILDGFYGGKQYLQRHTKYNPPTSEEKKVLTKFVSNVESGAFAGCWKVPVELEEH